MISVCKDLINSNPAYLPLPKILPPFLPALSHVLAVLGLVCPPLPTGVGFGAGRLWSVPVLPRARAAGCPQVEQQNSPASPTGGQCELQRWWQQCPDMMRRIRAGRWSVCTWVLPGHDGSQHLKDGDRKWKNVMRTMEKRPHPSFQLFPDPLHTWNCCSRDEGKVKLRGFEEFLKWNCTKKRRLCRRLGTWCPLEMCFKYNVNSMPSYTCANFYMHFVIQRPLHISHEVHLYCAFN